MTYFPMLSGNIIIGDLDVSGNINADGALTRAGNPVLTTTTADFSLRANRMPYLSSDNQVQFDRAAINGTGGAISTQFGNNPTSDALTIVASNQRLRFGPVTAETFIERENARQLSTDSALTVAHYTTATRPVVPADGYQIWDDTLDLPIWSKAAAGTGWINAAGVAV